MIGALLATSSTSSPSSIWSASPAMLPSSLTSASASSTPSALCRVARDQRRDSLRGAAPVDLGPDERGEVVHRVRRAAGARRDLEHVPGDLLERDEVVVAREVTGPC
jgi:hypothetical protein